MRPRFHFTAERGWINDPHGITPRDGGYDAFFQYVPDSTVWAPNCHWGHARGDDLFSLQELPVAIAPGEGDDGIWTGSLVTDDTGRTRVFYTSTSQPDIGIGRIRVAEPTDDSWLQWRKGDFVAGAPAELETIAYRDPFVVREPEGWRMFVGAGSPDGAARALSYTSSDLETWGYEGIALERSTTEREPVWMGALWECPQIFEVDGRWVMVSSVWDDDVLYYAGYAIGDYRDGRFVAETWGRLTYGPSYYAPSFFRDADGRPCLMFWMRGVEDLETGWASALSVPHVLGLDGDRLAARPHPDLERYRGAESATGSVDGLAADVVWTPEQNDMLVVAGADGGRIELRREDSSLIARSNGERYVLPFDGGSARLVLDAQAVEISGSQGALGFTWLPVGDGLSIVGGGSPVVHGLLR
ncbi:glycoside hydrolase family 32 protein [Agreia sp. PsM10]|uniref:glycoside hydrolase family 32 protein n=1 Tax=Agreia sp. PsM10 TaxID=3030533 RepID=UPI00263A484A|nr:glycoside hydrolase family 32 protein [Agreia sp. PsM10]MDN4640826.1 glycoside hydrolase family 32 protein [Agreia sp. PsM10]